MATEEKPNKPPKFSAYWIYAILIVLLLGLNLFTGGSLWQQPEKINQNLFEDYLRNGDVSKVVIVNKKEAEIYLTPEALEKEVHEKVKGNESSGNFLEDNKQPQYEFTLGDEQNFEKKFDQIVSENNLKTVIERKSESNFFGDILLSMLPFLILIIIWIFI